MKRFILEGASLRSEADFHGWAQKTLGLFEGYGWTMDALSDVLTDTSGLMRERPPFEVRWKNSEASREALEGRFDDIVRMLGESGIRVVLE